MKVVIENLYHINDGTKAYYRKQGFSCFDFTFDKTLASDLTESEVNMIMPFADKYMKQYGASKMYVEK